MKQTLTLAVILTVVFFSANAQQAVPNGGLETWTSSIYAPDGWTSYEDIIPPLAGTGLSMRDSVEKYEGASSVKLTSQYVSLAGDTVAGTLAIGRGVFGGGGPKLLGTPFASSPDTLEFAYKYAPTGTDTAGFNIKIHKAGGSSYKLQYHGVLASTAGQWVLISLPLAQFYTDTTGTTDTLLLEFNSSVFGGGGSLIKAPVGSVLHIDAVRFGYYTPVAGTAPDAYTMGHDPITGYDFNFYGAVNALGDSGVYKFVYSTDSTFATQSATPQQPLGGNSLKIVYATLASLSPATTYYYYVKATTNFGTTKGATMKFYSDTVAPIFANDGGDVSPGMNWAQLNGRLSKFHTNLNLYFEYGETPAMGKQIFPDVTNVTDSFTHYFRAYPDSLEAGKLYFFRAKAISATDTIYSDIRGFSTANNIYTVFQSLAASGVTDSAADINGSSKGFKLPLKHKVEVFNNNIGYHFHSPFHYYTPDTSLINYQYHKSGLLPGTLYSVRFKAETWAGNYYADGDFTTTGGTIGINNIGAENDLFVYPNPSTDLITLETRETLTGEANIQIYGMNGQLVKQQTITMRERKITFTVKDVSTGFYLLRLTVDGKTYNQKIGVVK